MKKTKRIVSLLLSIVMMLGMLPMSIWAGETTGLDIFVKVNSYDDSVYADVSSDDWFYDNVKSAYEYGLMVGKGGNLFDTEGNVTIVETMTIAARLHSIYYTGKADFVQSEPWYQVYADYCKENSIADPADYEMAAKATRAQFAVILANALPEEALESLNKVADDAIPDVKLTDSFGAAVYKLYRAGILTGNDENGTFAPNSNIRRSEVAAIVTRMAVPSLRKSIRLGNEYTVSFDKNYGMKSRESVTVAGGEKVTAPATPERNSYDFIGWYTLPEGGSKFDFDTEITGDITLYAHWEHISSWVPFPIPSFGTYYTVTFDSNGGSAVASQTVKKGECAVEPAEPTREGYDFAGWYSDSELTNEYSFAKSIYRDVTLYAKWEVAYYTVTFDSNGGSAVASQTVKKGECAVEPAEPTREGYNFAGWYSDSNLVNAYDFAAPVTKNITIYAKWESSPAEEYFTVTFDSNGGSAVASQKVKKGECAVEPAEPIFGGYAFEGWFKDSQLVTMYDFTEPVTNDIDLYAKWTFNGEIYIPSDLPLREDQTWEDLIEINGGEEPYVETSESNTLYIGKLSDNKVEDVFDVIAELNNLRSFLGIKDARVELVPYGEDGKVLDNSYRLYQVYNGVDVWCGQINVSVDDDGYINSVVSKYENLRSGGYSTTPVVTEDKALETAIDTMEIDDDTDLFSEVSLFIVPETGLIWYVVVENGNNNSYDFWIDAINGSLLAKNQIVDQTNSLNLNDYSDLKDVPYTFNVSGESYTVHMTEGTKWHFPLTWKQHYFMCDRTVIPDGIRMHNLNGVAHANARYPGNIFTNENNVWSVTDQGELLGLIGLNNFNLIAELYEEIGFDYDEKPIEVNVNEEWNNACYSYQNAKKTAIEFIFGTSSGNTGANSSNGNVTFTRQRIRQMDTIGHEYTHFTQDYYVNKGTVVDHSSSLGDGYSTKDSSCIDWVEAQAISEGTADIMGMLLEATVENRSIDNEEFWNYGEHFDQNFNNTHRDNSNNNKYSTDVRYHGSSNTTGNQTVMEMMDYYETRLREYNEGPGHLDGYVVVGILRYLVTKTDLDAEQLLDLWFTTITKLSPDSEFDDLRSNLLSAAIECRLSSYYHDIIDACESVGIYNGHRISGDVYYNDGTRNVPVDNITVSYCRPDGTVVVGGNFRRCNGKIALDASTVVENGYILISADGFEDLRINANFKRYSRQVYAKDYYGVEYDFGTVELNPLPQDTHNITGLITIADADTDMTNNLPLEGASVTLILTDNMSKTVTSDATGAYTLTDIPTGTYTITVSKEGFLPVTERIVVSETDTDIIYNIAIALRDATVFSITHTYNNVTTDILAASPIEVYNGSASMTWTISSGEPWKIVTNRGDWFSLSVDGNSVGLNSTFDAGETKLKLTISKYTDSRNDGTIAFDVGGETYTVEICQKASHLKGWIVAGLNQPINGAVVTVSNGEKSWNYTTGANGVFDIAVPNAWYTISVTAAGYESKSYDRDVLVNGEDVDIGEILLTKSTMNSLTGTIKDGDVNSPTYGQVLEGVSLEVYDSTGKKVGDTAKSNANGVVAFAFPAAGTYKFVFSLVGYETVTVDTVIINENTPSLGSYVMMRAKSNTSISGTTAPGTKLELLDEDGNVLAETVADENGKYEFKDIPGWDGTIFRIRIKDTTIIVDAVGGTTDVVVDVVTIFTISIPDIVRIDNEIGATSEWEIESSHAWSVTATGDTSWYTLSSTTGKCGITEFTVTANSVTDAYRESVLTFALNNRTFDVKIYQDVASIPDMPISEGLEYAEYDDHCVVTGPGTYTGKDLVIPSTHNGKPVTSIGSSAFVGCSGFTGSLVIPNSVTSIGYDAFNGCSGFTGSLVIPESVTSIGNSAFIGCIGFTGSLVIPDGVESIGSAVFGWCSGFTGSLVIPESVTNIGNHAFYGCSGFTGVYFNGNAPSVSSASEYSGSFSTDITLYYIESTIGWTDSEYYDAVAGTWNGYKLDKWKNTADVGIIASGYCGGDTTSAYDSASDAYENLTWTLYDDGKLVISGKGKMKDYYFTHTADYVYYTTAPWGKYIKQIKSLELTAGLTTIGNSAFEGCDQIVSNLVIPDTVLKIGERAFKNCSGFTGSLVIPDSVTSIGDYAFCECSGFTGSLVIPDSVTSIGDYAFYDCRGFTGSLVIPDSVTSIGHDAFDYCRGFTGSLVIPDSVESIGDWAFCDCRGFTGSLVIPDSVTSIGNYVFAYCSGFTGSLVIPDSVTSIGNYAFAHCSGFTGSLVIPESVKSIGCGAFSEMSSITEIINYSPDFSTSNGILYNSEMTELICCPAGKVGEITIPNTVKTIADYAFDNCTKLTGEFIIPDSVESIGYDAFNGCSGFTGSLVIPGSVTSIGHFAFMGCSGFTGSLVIPDSVESIGYAAFRNCSGFTGNLVIPDSVESIGDWAFYGCSGFTGVYFNGNAPSVSPASEDSGSFSTDITLYYIEGTIGWTDSEYYDAVAGTWNGYKLEKWDGTNISTFIASGYCGGDTSYAYDSASEAYKNLTWTLYDDGRLVIRGAGPMKDYSNNVVNASHFTTAPWSEYVDQMKSLKIDNGVTIIGSDAFYGCKCFIGSLVIPNTVTSIKRASFYECKGFNDILIIPNSVTTIGDWAFSYCGFTGNLAIPDSVTNIGSYAFNVCTGFDGKITLSNNIESIGKYAFNGCRGFTGSLVIPNSVSYINEYSFAYCEGITNIIIGNSVTSIGDCAFSGCSGLVGSINIPYSVVYIGKEAFYGCGATDFISKSPYYTTKDGILYNYNMSELIICPTGKIGTISIPETVKIIGNNAFGNCKKITGDIIIPDSVTEIGDYAFINCRWITGDMVIPSSVTNIGKLSFAGCVNLRDVYFNGNAPSVSPATENSASFPTNLTLYYIEGTTGWTDSEYYDSVAGTWNGYKLEKWEGASSYATVSGQVVDESGVPLENIKVQGKFGDE